MSKRFNIHFTQTELDVLRSALEELIIVTRNDSKNQDINLPKRDYCLVQLERAERLLDRVKDKQ